MRDHKYAVITCPYCHRSFVIVVRWTKTVRCRYCGRRIEVDLSRRVLYRDREDAARVASGHPVS
jgi:DNA-directed RNA polymerase subunit RPC12/RpoP